MVILSRTQKASSKLSQEWKNQSNLLLLGSKTLHEFIVAVIWCGKGGNVIRTLKKEESINFAKYLWDMKDYIMKGKYKLSSLPNFGDKQPLSWASKVIHIMNPQQYPLIYDSNIKKTMNIRDIKQFEKRLIEERKQSVNKSNLDIYKEDCDLWASQL